MFDVLPAGRGDARARRRHRAPIALVISVAGVFALCAGVAQAEAPKLISYGDFSAPQSVVGVGVEPGGEVFVAGLFDSSKGTSGHIEKFDAAGKPLSPPSPFGEDRYTGVAVNPANGDVYVLDNVLEASEEGFEAVIGTYDPSSGALLSSFSVPKSGNAFFGSLTAVQIATDSSGNLYVPVAPENEVREYSPSGTLLQTFTGSGAGALSEPTGVAVDSSGDVWVADAKDNRIEELGPAGAPIGEIKSEGVQSVALDGHGDVFAIVRNSADFCGSLEPPCSHLVEYGSAGSQLADIGASEFAPNETFGLRSMLAVNGSSGQVYVTDSGNERVWIFGPPTAPTVGNELAAKVTTSEAKVGALINPGGLNTIYNFEYGTTSAYGHTTPFPQGNVGEGVSARAVWASANGLAPGTTYHYRVIATNELGTSSGPDETFTTGTAEAVACPNEELRSGFSAALPDCRAYELVTPPNKVSAQPDETTIPTRVQGNLAAREGDRFSFVSIEVLPGADAGGYEYLSTRGSTGWMPESVLPRQSYTDDRCTLGDTHVQAYSADMKEAVVYDGGNEKAGERKELRGGCGVEPIEVASGEPMGYENLLLRDNEDGSYRLINVTPPGTTPANAHFDSASSDLSRICFSEHARLTPDAPAGVENEYEWIAGSLRLVTAAEPQQCRVAQEVEAGGSKPNEASGYKYFVSRSVLTGAETNQHGEGAQEGQLNLYLSHGGAMTFIATVPDRDYCVFEGTACSRVSPDGRFLAFSSHKSLTGYENHGAFEIYLYDAASNQLACASCNPSGEAPTVEPGPGIEPGAHINAETLGGAPHYLTADGQVFFETLEALLPSDTNGQSDVYEYEDGQLHLISPGTSAKPSVFLDASENGGDVFFLTRLQLLPGATNEEALSIYDARVDGGFAEPSAPPPCVTADSCRAPVSPQPTIFGAPTSSTFSGVGNLAPPAAVKSRAKPKKRVAKCRKGLVRRKGKCVKKPRKKAGKSAHAPVNNRTGK